MADSQANLDPIPFSPWSKRLTLAIYAVAFVVWIVYSVIGPGEDFFICYTWMVTLPEKIREVSTFVWTLNPTWLVPFMAPFVSLPGRAGYIVFMAASIAMMVYGARTFGGKAIPVLLSAQLFWVLWWGQIEGWAILALVVGVMALKKHSWPLMFLALVMGSFKPQIGFIPLIALWWWSGRQRWISLAGMILLVALNVVIWGPWPVWYFEGLTSFVGDKHYEVWNASLGLYALPLFIPALLLPLTRYQRLMALTATGLLVIPYMPYYSTIILLVFNIPWWAYIFAFTSYLPNLIGPTLAWKAVALMPLSVLAWLYWPYVRKFITDRKKQKEIKDGGSSSSTTA
jgi:hypothetical protein